MESLKAIEIAKQEENKAEDIRAAMDKLQRIYSCALSMAKEFKPVKVIWEDTYYRTHQCDCCGEVQKERKNGSEQFVFKHGGCRWEYLRSCFEPAELSPTKQEP